MVVDVEVVTSSPPAPPVSRLLALGWAAGLISGFVVAGLLGRVAMRVLAATSPTARGATTDDGATVGVISLDGTGFLMVFTAALGAVSGIVYLAVRRFLPERFPARVATCAAGSGAIGGALLVHDHTSFDYSALGPQWLAVAMFVAVPAISGAVTAALVEIGVRRHARVGRLSWWQLAAGVAGGVLFLPGLAGLGRVGGTIVLVGLLAGLVPAVRRLWATRPVAAVVTVALVLAVGWGVYDLVTDIASIATDRPNDAPLTV